MNATQSMNKERFWEILDNARQATGDWKSMFEPLMDSLSALDEQDIIKWGHIFDQYFVLADKEKLSVAIDIMHNGCSDSGYDYFRAWLIAQGKVVYYKALANPDSLASVKSVKQLAREVNASEYAPIRGYVSAARFEEMLSAAPEAYERRKGHDKVDGYYKVAKESPLSKAEIDDIASGIKYAKDIDTPWCNPEDGNRERWTKQAKLLPRLYKAFNDRGTANL